MIPWPWLIAAFVCGGIASLGGAFLWLTGGYKLSYIYLWKAMIDWAKTHPDEAEERAKQLAWDECRQVINF